MNVNLSNKNALVCGSSKGLGKAAAIELAKLGANVTLVARNVDRMAEAMTELAKSGKQDHDFLVADFSDSQDLRKKVRALLASKPIHILINNTGGPKGGAIINAKEEEFVQALHNHLICNHLLTQLISPVMKKEGYGRIINIISTSVRQPILGLGVSNTTRGAVASWSKTLSHELAPFGITVNNILPGTTSTERLEELLTNKMKAQNLTREEAERIMLAEIPMQRFATPEEIGTVIAFVASPAASYITGANIPVDGGKIKSL